MNDLTAEIGVLAERSLLVLDDDASLRIRLGRALEQRGFEVTLVGSVTEAITAVKASAPSFAVLDMRLEDGSGLSVVEAIRAARSDARVVMLTGYGNIATAVAAVKSGAVDYLSKPADADDVARALLAGGEDRIHPPGTVERIARLYGKQAVFEIQKGMSHWLIGEPGWEKVCDRALAWLAKA